VKDAEKPAVTLAAPKASRSRSRFTAYPWRSA
jgi:hypothetical protein